MENTLNEAIQSARAKDANVKGLYTQLTMAQEEASKNWSIIRQRIQNGETTGDQLTDFAILRYGFYFAEAIDVHRNLEKQVAECQGQFVMLVKKTQEQIRWGGSGSERPDDFIPRIKLEAGVISGHSFVFNKDKLSFSFPTGGKHIAYPESFSGAGVQTEILSSDLGVGFLDEIVLKNHTDLLILWGDQDVIKWFQDHCSEHWLKVFRLMNISLEKIIEFPELQEFLKKRQAQLLRDYQMASAGESFLSLKCSELKESDKDYGSRKAGLAAIVKEKEDIAKEAYILGLQICL